jgi:hypothetical protein
MMFTTDKGLIRDNSSSSRVDIGIHSGGRSHIMDTSSINIIMGTINSNRSIIVVGNNFNMHKGLGRLEDIGGRIIMDTDTSAATNGSMRGCPRPIPRLDKSSKNKEGQEHEICLGKRCHVVRRLGQYLVEEMRDGKESCS